MPDLNTMAPVPKPERVGARELGFLPLSIVEVSGLQSWIKKTYPHPLDAVRGHLDGLSPDERSEILRAAAVSATDWPPKLGTPEAENHIRGIEGMQEIFRIMVRKADPAMTDDDVTALAASISSGRFFAVMGKILDIALGDDEPDPKDADAAPAA